MEDTKCQGPNTFVIRKKIEDMKLERMHYIAKYFPDQHLERIDRRELVERLCWENYHAEKDPMKKVKILESIITIQPYLSGYYEATKMILDSSVRVNDSNDNEEPIVGDGWTPGLDGIGWTDSKVPKSIIRVGVGEGEGEITDSLEQEHTQVPDTQFNLTERKPVEKEPDGEEWEQLQCPNCLKYFYNNFTLSAHMCNG